MKKSRHQNDGPGKRPLRHSDAARIFPLHVQNFIDRRIREVGALMFLSQGELAYDHVTAETIESELANFPLALVRDWNWLAMSIRQAFTLTTPYLETMDNGFDGNIATRKKLQKLARDSAKLARELGNLEDPELEAVSAAFQDTGMATLKATVARLEFLGESFEIVANGLKQQRSKWRTMAGVELRIRQAQYLAPVFESAFSQTATFNDWSGASLGPWADFFQRIATLATGEKVSDLRNTLKEARKRNRSNPVSWIE